MSEIRINIFDEKRAVSGTLHGSLGEFLVAALTAEPETIEELETAVERFVKRESDWSFFRSFKNHEDFESYDAGLLVIDLASKVILSDSTYSHFSEKGSVRIKTAENEDFNLPYKLSEDWKSVNSTPEFEYWQSKKREKLAKNPPFDAREILFGNPLFEFITAEFVANADSKDENLFVEIHAKWLMTEREDLRGMTPREIMLEKHEFISSDLHSRELQWSFTKACPPPISKDSNAFRFAGFGTNELVVYYDLIRFLLNECFERKITNPNILRELAAEWLNNPEPEFSGRIPAKIIESERSRLNLTMSAHECLVDEDCETCQMMAVDFIDTPMFWGLDGSQMEFDRFEFSFEKSRDEWEAEQRRWEEFNRNFKEGELENNDDFDDDLIY